jgi:tetratricopeptide (TPR) repeat protein
LPNRDGAPLRRTHAVTVAGLLLLFVALTVFESTVAPRTFWGAHHYAFYPRFVLVLAVAVAVLACLPLLVRGHDGDEAPPGDRAANRPWPAWVPWVVAIGSGALFWTFRIRHLFWGDALPLSILIPQGQSFHPDEPLSLFVHQAIYRLGRGAWSGSEAVAIGSTLAGAVFAGWASRWIGRLTSDRLLAALAVVVLVLQGYAPLFFGYVENYSYLAVALLVFWTSGIDHLQGRGPLWIPLVAAVAALAFHVLGGLLLVPLGFLLVRSVARRAPGRRMAFVAVGLGVLAAALLAWGLLAGRLGVHDPLARVAGRIGAVLTDAGTMTPSFLLSPGHLRDVWSELVLLGPLSAPLLVALLLLLPTGRRFAGSATGTYLLIGGLVFLVPVLLTGEGNLGPARNWDLFAAPAITWTLTGIVFLLTQVGTRAARRVLVGLAVVTLVHVVPWIAINADAVRVRERLLALPLGRGRNALVLGTHHLNRGELGPAETWFRAAVAEDSSNANSQSGLGVVLARTGREAEALGPMTRAVKLRPNVPQFRKDLAALHASRGACAEAGAEWEAARALDPLDLDPWRGRVEALWCAGDELRALEWAEEAERRFPGRPEVVALLATAHDRKVARLGLEGRWPEAREALAAFARRFPGDPRIAVLGAALDEASGVAGR